MSSPPSGSYDPRAVEGDIYTFWEDGNYFAARPDPNRKPYTIVIPPPNVTGALHLGHALNNTLQDTLIRRKRMKGYNACWLPGTDHAGIATQAMVEKRLKEDEGLTRHEIGREELVNRIWKWKDDYGGRILNQLRKMGCSCDWSRTRFTLDDVCARAVYETFFRFFKEGLIFRGLRLVNWDTQLQTAVADDEIVHETVKGSLWKMRYPVLEGNVGVPSAISADDTNTAYQRASADNAQIGRDYLVVATTRPETMLGDTAVAVHPDDERYQHLIGRHVLLPLVNRPIPVIADGQLVRREFGSGCVKVTPGHDPNDYACGQRNNLQMINILTPDGNINDAGKSGAFGGFTGEGAPTFDYESQDRYAARKQIVADLEQLGLMDAIDPYEHEVGHSDRSKTPIEPLLSEQWFLKTTDLAENAMEAVRDERVQFFPPRYAQGYLDWLGEKRDWCISRQLWWGHRIPVWSKRAALRDFSFDKTPSLIAACTSDAAMFRVITAAGDTFDPGDLNNPDWPLADNEDALFTVCLRNPEDQLAGELESAGFVQEEDVLDTWFSSALWPFSTFGWPETDGDRAKDLNHFFPTDVLSTARDIISLWVARMVMTSLYNTGRVPFSHVTIHPTLQDAHGRRMSKSKGNGLDPLDLIDDYGADAMRFTLAALATETQDIRVPIAYRCPHCRELIPHTSAVPHNKFPIDIKQAKCTNCKKDFATVWAPDDLKKQLGVALDTSERFETGRNFCNKLWQAATGFVLPNLRGYAPRALSREDLALEDRWILSRLLACIAECDRRLDRYQYSDYAAKLYSFFWTEFCDWYVELLKPRLYEGADETSAATARQVLAFVLDQSLRLMHPVMPFITEKLWNVLHEVAPQRGLAELRTSAPALIVAEWPCAGFRESAACWEREAPVEAEIALLQEVIGTIREIRASVNGLRAAARETVVQKLPRAVILAQPERARQLRELEPVLKRLAQVESIEIGARPAAPGSTGASARSGNSGGNDSGGTGVPSVIQKPPASFSKILAGAEVYVPLKGLADIEVARSRLEKEAKEVEGHLKRVQGKLSNKKFVDNAPAAVVEQERARQAELEEKLSAVQQNLADLA